MRTSSAGTVLGKTIAQSMLIPFPGDLFAERSSEGSTVLRQMQEEEHLFGALSWDRVRRPSSCLHKIKGLENKVTFFKAN